MKTLIKIAKKLCEEGLSPKEIAEDMRREQRDIRKYIHELKILGWARKRNYNFGPVMELTEKGRTQIAIGECDICEHPRYLSEERRIETSCVCGKKYGGMKE